MIFLTTICRPIQSAFFKAVTNSRQSSSSSYSVKIAQVEDIPFIRNCNLANLPENYDNNFYHHQLKTWPELSLVCQDNEERIVGYALGRVLESNELSILSSSPFSSSSGYPLSYKGHVASIAVSQSHRGNKLAQNMMDIMHMQFALNYDIDEIDLYCRVCRIYVYILVCEHHHS